MWNKNHLLEGEHSALNGLTLVGNIVLYQVQGWIYIGAHGGHDHNRIFHILFIYVTYTEHIKRKRKLE
jgi:hypothetical protein